MSILDICKPLFRSYMDQTLSLESIMKYNVLRKLFLDYYTTKVFMNKLEPIENLTREEKLEYWEETKQFPDKETRLQAVKVLYVFAHLAQDYEAR